MRAQHLCIFLAAAVGVAVPVSGRFILGWGQPEVPLVLVVVDGLRADAISTAAGSTPTPNMDALVADGVRFTHVVTQASANPAGRLALLTGRDPADCGGFEGVGSISSDVVTLASWLARNNYQTRSMAAPVPPKELEHTLAEKGFSRVIADAKGKDVRALLQPTFANLDTSRPFFLLVNLTHTTEATGTANLTAELEVDGHTVLNPELEKMHSAYKKGITAADRALGELLAELRKRGIYDRALIVLTSDHGRALGEHGVLGTGTDLYDEMLRVPLVIKPPKGDAFAAEAAERSTKLGAQVDIAPTLLSILGARALPGCEGESLLVPEDRVVHSETHPPQAGESLYSVRDDEYKLVYRPRSDDFLMYSLGPDPGELDNVFEIQGHLRKNWQADLRRRARLGMRAAHANLGP